jgi:putative ABC transport system permease protein
MLSSFGISLAAAVLVLGSFIEDALDYLIEFQFYVAQRQDMNVAFFEPSTSGILHEVEHLPGVIRAEPFRSVPVRLRHGHRSRRLAIMAIRPGAELYRLLDKHEREVVLPPDGLVVSEKLAELLEAQVGDTIIVEVQEQERPVREVQITGLVADFSGTNAYMDAEALHRLLREGDSISGAFLAVDDSQIDTLYSTLKNTPHVASVTIQSAMIDSFDETIRENQMRMRFFNVMFACIIAFGVVYNTARISLSERSRELATLRVIGFTRGEISAILLGELGVLTLAALPVGLFLGYCFAAIATWAFSTDMYRIPLVVNRSTFAFAATVVLVASLISGLVVRRRLDELDLVAVLKSKE